MIVSSLPFWIILIVAILITSVYWVRNRKGVMGNFFIVLIVFSLNLFFFAYGIVLFLIFEYIRSKKNKK